MCERRIRRIAVLVTIGALIVAALCYCCTGCTLMRNEKTDPSDQATPAGPATPTPDPPRDEKAGVAAPSAADQQGGVNTAVQGVTGLAFTRNEAMPFGLAVLVALVLMLLGYLMRLSHMREMTRIRQNGKAGRRDAEEA